MADRTCSVVDQIKILSRGEMALTLWPRNPNVEIVMRDYATIKAILAVLMALVQLVEALRS